MTPTEYTLQPQGGSYVTPRFEQARVYDGMRKGIVTCAPDTPLRDVARIMASSHIHCIVVADVEDETRSWSVLSDLDLAHAVRTGGTDRTAAEVAASEPISVSSEDTMEHAAQLMSDHDTAHLVVVHGGTGQPIGIVSTLDLAGILAWGEA